MGSARGNETVSRQASGGFDLAEVVGAASRAMDMIDPRLVDHHHRTAYIAHELASTLGLPLGETMDIVLAALVHDVGAFRLSERVELLKFEQSFSGEKGDHAEMGARLLDATAPLRRLSPLVRAHHDWWSDGGSVAPVGARILHLADRLAVSVQPGVADPEVAKRIQAQVRAESGRMFSPVVVDAFRQLAEREAFWFDLASPTMESLVTRRCEALGRQEVDLYAFREIARFICALVDYRSRFTATHSRGVAACADRMAGFLGWNEDERVEVEVAGLLHDVGKLAVSDEIIEKPSRLSEKERWLMMQHPYHTHRVLQSIHGANNIDHYASNHHEHWGGGSYPFHADPDRLLPGARLMAVADVFTALTEPRPYRRPMKPRQAMEQLQKMANRRKLDPQMVGVARRHFDELDSARETEQRAARVEYQRFSNPDRLC